jgi:hypothetical protein
MTSYHKPKIYRSIEGCCICKAKSSSSRFTDSEKYESEFSNCFRLRESREGDICNACVLIVKRWKHLPKDTKKHWAHVVDAKHGPGNKQSNKQKKKEDHIETFQKIRKKCKTKKIKKTDPAAMSAGISATENRTSDSFGVPDFIDLHYWKRSAVCCGVIYRGECGELMVDQRLFRRCAAHSTKPSIEAANHAVPATHLLGESKGYEEDLDYLSLYSDSDSSVSKLSNATIDTIDTDGDEGFFGTSELRHLI